jgi:hypothetical protein
MDWQRGNLIEANDKDKMLVGDREMQMVKVLKKPTKELQPHPKLRQPSIGTDEDILFTI